MRGALAVLLAAGLAMPASAGRLDLDVYSSAAPPPFAGAPIGYPRAGAGWLPGDPRDLRGEPRWVQYTSQAGYAGFGLAGLATSVAAGMVAPAIGFGIVSAVQLYRAWRLRQTPAGPGPAR